MFTTFILFLLPGKYFITVGIIGVFIGNSDFKEGGPKVKSFVFEYLHDLYISCNWPIAQVQVFLFSFFSFHTDHITIPAGATAV